MGSCASRRSIEDGSSSFKSNIVQRTQSGKLMVSPEKREEIDRSAVRHLGRMKRAFDSGELNEDLVFNMDETHFVVNMDDKKTLALKGDTEIKYADVVSGDEGISMVLRMSGGEHSRLTCPMLIFKNKSRSYPIRNVPDDVPGVTYRSAPKGFMDRLLFTQWLQEPRCNPSDMMKRPTYLFLDNFSGHGFCGDDGETHGDVLTEKSITMCFLPPNTIDMLQPLDSFVISKVKQYWRERWNAKKWDMIRNKEYQTSAGGKRQGSGKLKNPGKTYFLQLAADCVKQVNKMRDEHGQRYTRKAMVICGLSKDYDGVWRTSQLQPKLQELIKKYPEEFDRPDPPADDEQEGFDVPSAINDDDLLRSLGEDLFQALDSSEPVPEFQALDSSEPVPDSNLLDPNTDSSAGIFV